MKTEEIFDLRIASYESEETVSEDILVEPKFDVIRVYEPTASQCARLLPLGFIYKPSWLFWVRPVYSTVDEYLSSLDRHTRGLIRTAARRIEANYRTCIELKLNPETFKSWLPLYQKRMAELPRGLDYATEDSELFLSEPEKYVGVFIYHENHLIAGGLSLKIPDKKMLRLIYFASDSSFRYIDLSRYVYFTISNIARELKYQTMSAGADPNFYGHYISTGLYLFKKRMGFQAEPRQKYEQAGSNVLEKIVSLKKCENLSFCLGYASSNPMAGQFVGHAFSNQSQVDTSHLNAPFLQEIVLHCIAN